MYTKLKQRQQGFSIIEVMIVMAIAGLIMLIVFLAVPALQRNSRNTQRKNDVAGLLGGVAEYSNNNQGAVPATITFSTVAGTTWFINGATASATSGTPVKSGYYVTTGSVTMGVCTAANCGTTADAGIVKLFTNAVCAGNAITNANATGRNIAALYAVEPGATSQCQQS